MKSFVALGFPPLHFQRANLFVVQADVTLQVAPHRTLVLQLRVDLMNRKRHYPVLLLELPLIFFLEEGLIRRRESLEVSEPIDQTPAIPPCPICFAPQFLHNSRSTEHRAHFGFPTCTAHFDREPHR